MIKARKIADIPYDENWRIINMDETPSYLEMNYATTIDFLGYQLFYLLQGTDIN